VSFEAANLQRDRVLRKHMLRNLDNALQYGPTGELDGRTLMRVAQSGLPPRQQFENDGHAVKLIRDLENKGYATLKIVGLRRGQTAGLDHMIVKIAAKGTSLLNESIDIDPDVDDERVEA
jgi:hypothetical protein